MRLAFIASVLFLLSCVTGALRFQERTHSFEIFILREDAYAATEEATARIIKYYRTKPEDVPLAKSPVISDKNIAEYDWKTHAITLRKDFAWRVQRPSMHGVPFVVVADGIPIYVGAFYSGFSSIPCPVPVVMFEQKLETNVLQIQRAYPGEPFGQGNDPRSDERIRKALLALGKLKE